MPCPACHELNVPAAVVCIRCGADMVPPPPPEPVPVPLPEPVVVVPAPEVREPEPAEPFPWWWLAAVLGIAAVAWLIGSPF